MERRWTLLGKGVEKIVNGSITTGQDSSGGRSGGRRAQAAGRKAYQEKNEHSAGQALTTAVLSNGHAWSWTDT
jgi:hypothetical protein